MFECPVCATVLTDDALICNHCKWQPLPTTDDKTAPRRKTITIHAREISVKPCQHLDRGQHCNEIARFSSSTLGGGPFYCHKHFPPFRGR